jgi:hypothetical protein
MSVVVVDAGKHGATQRIAGHTAVTLRAQGADLTAHEAFGAGRVVSCGSWPREAAEWARGHRLEGIGRERPEQAAPSARTGR